MNREFNLISSHWVPVISLGATRPTLVTLGDALADAHRLQMIYASTPPETAAVYRLLLAVLQAALKEIEEPLWKALWHQGFFPSA